MAELDLSQVKWDDKPQIDPAQVQWDDQPQKKVTLGMPGFAQSVREELALNAGPLDRLAMGVSGVVDDAAMRFKQLAGNPGSLAGQVTRLLGIKTELTPEEQQAVVANRVNRESLEGMTGAILGGTAMTGAPAAAMQRGLTSALLPKAAGAISRTVAPTVAAAGTGATIAAGTNPVLPGESEAQNAAYGAIGGAVGNAAGRILERVFQFVKPTPQAQKLIDEGVQPTVGQAAGANSMLGRIEQGLQSIPVVGDIIRNARGKATEEFNVAAIRRALPVNDRGQITQAGRDSITEAQRILSDGYDNVLARIGRLQIDQPFVSAVRNIATDPDLSLPPALQQRYAQILAGQFQGRIANGEINADLAKRVDSNLGSLHRRYMSSADGDQRALGAALAQAQAALRSMFERSASDPVDAQTLRALNGHYSNLLRVERAASYVGAEDGVFTAAQLSRSVRAMDPSRNKRAYAQGRAQMQDLSDAGRATLNQTVPDSGTTGRAMLAAAALGGAGAANEQFDIAPSWATAALLSPLLFSRTGSRALTGQLTPDMLRVIQSATPYATGMGSILANQNK
jgi:hypothetical protein